MQWLFGGHSCNSTLFEVKKKIRDLWALVVNAEGRGLEALVEQVLDQPCICSYQIWGCVVFKSFVQDVIVIQQHH